MSAEFMLDGRPLHDLLPWLIDLAKIVGKFASTRGASIPMNARWPESMVCLTVGRAKARVLNAE